MTKYFISGKTLLLVLISAIWLIAAVYCFSRLLNYKRTAGTVGEVPRQWPENTFEQPRNASYTLLLFLHPKCPCSNATVSELAQLLSDFPGKISAHVFFYRPAQSSAEWAYTGLWQRASELPGVIVHGDVAARVAQSFGARTSGQTLLYDSTGKLLFSGGITFSRGHVGNNAGRAAIGALVGGQEALTRSFPVFGCSLLDPVTATNQLVP